MLALKAAISVALLLCVFWLVTFHYDTAEILLDVRGLSPSILGVVVLALLANVFAAVLRFQVIAADVNHRPVAFRRAMAVVSAGSLAGAIFFQIAGQLMARGVIAGRGGISFATVVVITAYERFMAAAVSALLALAGALYIFGNVYLDQGSGGADLVKIVCGLATAIIGGALLGYGRSARQWLTPLLTRHFARRCVTGIGLSLLVQLPMMVAYVALAQALSPRTNISDLLAASTIVMFAASVPISLAGWGVREMSAVVALGAIGVAPHAALAAAIIVGVGSMLAVGIVAATSVPTATSRTKPQSTESARSVNCQCALAWALPTAAATLVLFQIHVPVQSALLNVNLADPIAILGGVLFILSAVRLRRLPPWRIQEINIAVAIATLVLANALLIGVYRFEWTTWAVVNRFLGWFVLLSYAATGALVVAENQRRGLRILLLTFAGAAAAIAGFETILIMLRSFGSSAGVIAGTAEGFAQNRNAFAFQLLMAMSAAIVLARGVTLRRALLSLILMGLWFAGSRSGWIAATFVLAMSIYLGLATFREILLASLIAAGAAIGAVVLAFLSGHLDALPGHMIPTLVPDTSSTHERLVTILGGINLFLEHPIFGAGLGAFRNEMIPSGDGTPLVIHSTPVWLLAELGVLGFVVFVGPAIYVFIKQWRYAPKEPGSALIILSFVAFAVMSGPADMLYQRTFWLVFGAGLALRQTAKLPAKLRGLSRASATSFDSLAGRTANA
jgi:uncharacterized membrane protein YbhN (UPF0104 family)